MRISKELKLKLMNQKVDMDIVELLEHILEVGKGQCVAWCSFDSEYGWTISEEEYVMVRLGNKYVIICIQSETDFYELPICMCSNVEEILSFLQYQMKEYNQMEGTKFEIADNIEEIKDDIPDRAKSICKILDEYFALEQEEDENKQILYPIKPSEIILSLANGVGLRPENPKGFVIDTNDIVYIRNGSIRFGPIGGDERYFSEYLGTTLDCLGVKWEKQRFLLTHENFRELQDRATAEEFLHMFKTSTERLEEYDYNFKLDALNRDKEEIEKQIEKLKKRKP